MVFSVFAILLFSIFSFNSYLYWLLVPKAGVGWAYVFDQLFPLGIALLAFLFFIKRKKIRILLFLKRHGLYLVLFFLITMFVHSWILGFYFLSEEPTTILASALNNNDRLITLLRGYPYAIYVASFLIFGTNVWLYNLVTLTLYVCAAGSLYVLIHTLIGNKFAAFLGTVFFITTPSYLTMFNWQSNAPGMSLALVSGIFSLLFLLLYQKKKFASTYILSLLFYIAAIKMGIGRTAGFIVLPLFFIFFPLYTSKTNIKKSIALSSPYIISLFLLILIVFLIPDHGLEKIILGQSSQITVRSEPLHLNNYFPALFTWVAYLFLPNQFAGVFYGWVRTIIEYIPQDFSITFVVGSFFSTLLLSIGIFSAVHIKKKYRKIILFSIIWIFSNLFFIPLFVGDYHDLSTTDWYFARIDIGSAPGTKYVFFSSIGISILIAVCTLWLRQKYRRIFSAWLILLVILIGTYVLLSRDYYKHVLNDTPYLRVIPDKVFSLVPRDGRKKLLFSTNPIKNAIDNQTGTYGEKWLNSFYLYSELFYTNDRSLVEKLIQEEKYKKENVYAFYNNPTSLTFKDISQLARKELFLTNKKQEGVVDIVRHTNDPFALENELFTSVDLNERFLLPKKIIIHTNKNSDFDEVLLTIRYACAEKKDWDIQKEDPSEPVANIWKDEKTPVSNLHTFQETTLPIDCYGSVLRKVIILADPYPTNITLKRITLQ